MSKYTDSLRDLLVRSTFDDAQKILIQLVRLAARNRIWDRARQFKIMDYSDTQLVEESHRTFRQNTINAGLDLVSQAQAATTKAELEPVFDTIEPWLEV